MDLPLKERSRGEARTAMARRARKCDACGRERATVFLYDLAGEPVSRLCARCLNNTAER